MNIEATRLEVLEMVLNKVKCGEPDQFGHYIVDLTGLPGACALVSANSKLRLVEMPLPGITNCDIIKLGRALHEHHQIKPHWGWVGIIIEDTDVDGDPIYYRMAGLTAIYTPKED